MLTFLWRVVMSEFDENDEDGGIAVLEPPTTETDIIEDEETKSKSKHARRWKIVLLNNDVTPFEFVMFILEKIFKHSQHESLQRALAAHVTGRAICFSASKEKCETRLDQARNEINASNHPFDKALELKLESDEDE